MAPKPKPPPKSTAHVPVSIAFATADDIQYLSEDPSPPLSPTTHSGGEAAVPSKRRPRPRATAEITEDAFGPPPNLNDDALGPRLSEDASGPPQSDYADEDAAIEDVACRASGAAACRCRRRRFCQAAPRGRKCRRARRAQPQFVSSSPISPTRCCPRA